MLKIRIDRRRKIDADFERKTLKKDLRNIVSFENVTERFMVSDGQKTCNKQQEEA